jgi:hypothetical protein
VECIDPNALSLVEAQFSIPSARITTYGSDVPLQYNSVNCEISIPPRGSNISLDFQENELLPGVKIPFLFPNESPPFDIGFHGQQWCENEFSSSEALSDFTFDSTTHLSRASPFLDSNSRSSIQSKSFTPPISPYQYFNHTRASPQLSVPDTNGNSLPSSSSAPSTGGIPCTWPSCNKSFPSTGSYK